MSDPVLADAISRRDAALAEARRWDEFARMYCELRGIHYDMQSDKPDRPAAPPRRERSAVGAPSNSLVATEEAAIAVLKEAGRPMPTGELRPALEARGIEIGGRDANSTLSARLSRSARLYNQRPHGWWIKEKADDDAPRKDASPASQPQSTPVEPGEEVAHDNTVGDRPLFR